MNFKLQVWKQRDATATGRFEAHEAENIPDEASFLEMLDIVNETLLARHDEPIAFDSDCREGICGVCSLVINGIPHGPGRAKTTCQLYMRHFRNNDVIWIEPFRASAFPLLRDLAVDRRALDGLIEAGGFVSVRTGSAPEANSIPIAKARAELSMEAAACIGCGACVAACPNSSAMLFVGAKVAHLGLLPQGEPERYKRVISMVQKMDDLGFGNCRNYYECEAVCPAEINRSFIANLNREYAVATARHTLGLT
jgi:succinate dehydrogenase / fumarate reductase, iron-sulfur subunit